MTPFMFQRLNDTAKAEDKSLFNGKTAFDPPRLRALPSCYTVDPEKPYRRLIIKAWNSLSEQFGFKSVIDSQSLLEAASKRMGLDDFGPAAFMEPLQLMIRSVEKGDNLHSFGRFCFRQLMINLLVNRLFIENESKKSPYLSNNLIDKPLIIMGLPRTGTSFLLNMLASDHQFRHLAGWEAMRPVLPENSGISGKRGKRRKRRLMAALELNAQNYLAPSLKIIHRYYVDGPEECTRLFFNQFTCQALDLVFNMPVYREWLKNCNYIEAYTYHKRQLQLLNSKGESRRWLLKSPYHLPALEALLQTYPDAKIIHLYRDPLKSVSSFCSLTAAYRGICGRKPEGHQIGGEAADFLQNAVARFLKSRESMSAINILDISYDDLIGDPLNTVKHIYRSFDMTLADDTLEELKGRMSASLQIDGPLHNYSPEQFGLTGSDIQRRFSAYIDKFNL